MFKKLFYILCFSILFVGCTNDPEDNGYIPVTVSLTIPRLFEENILPPIIPEDNPLTEEGIALGKKLFFDPILSGDQTQACGDCHRPQNAFDDPRRFSEGINGQLGFRNSMPLQNLAWNFGKKFNWDGSASSLEEQIFEPVTNPIEMANTWPNAVNSLQETQEYPILFEQAFGIATIDSVMVTKAIAQFIRTLISGNTKFDRYLLGEEQLTASEERGFNLFMDEEGGDCFHCHGNPRNPLWTDNKFHNNGLDAFFTDRGLGGVTGDPRDDGKFRSPSIRNLAFTAPYMHDGRFDTLEEVINHYSEGLVFSETIDPLMKAIGDGGVQLTQQEKDDLKTFLLSLSDSIFINNPNFSN